MKTTRPTYAASERGFALLVTLVMLSLLAVILGGLARRSAYTALQANDAEQAMRQRWAELSCGHTLLTTASDRADKRLDDWRMATEGDTSGTVQNARPVASESFHFKLAGLNVWGRIDDEQSKINLNHRLASSPDASVSPKLVIDDALGAMQSSALQLTREPFVRELGLPRVMSWKQVLPRHQPPDLLGVRGPEQLPDRQGRSAVADRLTLWGDGLLNIWTTDRETLRRGLAASTAHGSINPGTIGELLDLRENEPALGLSTLIANATADQADDRKPLHAMLTERSSCFTLWLAIRSNKHDNAHAQWSLRVVESEGDSDAGPTRQYRW